MTLSDIDWLADWYRKQCNDEWEHSYGVSLTTVDNPGWRLEVDLQDTPLEAVAFVRTEHNVDSDEDWWVCEKQGPKFVAAGGPLNLSDIVRGFRRFVETNEQK